jgi:hypothetical protein
METKMAGQIGGWITVIIIEYFYPMRCFEAVTTCGSRIIFVKGEPDCESV